MFIWLSQTPRRGTHVHPHFKGCLFDYHKHGTLTYTPMLMVVYLIITNTGTHVHPYVNSCLFDYHKHVHPHVKGCLFDYHKHGTLTYTPMQGLFVWQTRGTHVHPHAKGCLFDYHKHEALTYNPMLMDVYVIYHKHGALTYTPILRVVYLIITNTGHSRTPLC